MYTAVTGPCEDLCVVMEPVTSSRVVCEELCVVMEPVISSLVVCEELCVVMVPVTSLCTYCGNCIHFCEHCNCFGYDAQMLQS